MSRVVHCTLCVGVLIVMPAVVWANSIPWLTDTNTGAVVFDDNFESGALGSAPLATTGTWSVPATSPVATVVDTGTAGFAANEGNQFMKLTRGAGGQEYDGYGIAANSGDGHTIRLEMAFQAAAGADGNIGTLADSTETSLLLFTGSGTVDYFATNPGRWVALNQAYNTTGWNTLVITHVNTAGSDYKVSINGAAFESIGSYGAGNWSGVELDSPGNGLKSLYVDSVAVPEPATITLFSIGMVGLLAYAWRKRK